MGLHQSKDITLQNDEVIGGVVHITENLSEKLRHRLIEHYNDPEETTQSTPNTEEPSARQWVVPEPRYEPPTPQYEPPAPTYEPPTPQNEPPSFFDAVPEAPVNPISELTMESVTVPEPIVEVPEPFVEVPEQLPTPPPVVEVPDVPESIPVVEIVPEIVSVPEPIPETVPVQEIIPESEPIPEVVTVPEEKVVVPEIVPEPISEPETAPESTPVKEITPEIIPVAEAVADIIASSEAVTKSAPVAQPVVESPASIPFSTAPLLEMLSMQANTDKQTLEDKHAKLMQDKDQEWQLYVDERERHFTEVQRLSGEELHAHATRVEGRLGRYAPPPPTSCDELRSRVQACYLSNQNTPLNCASIVSRFRDCVYRSAKGGNAQE